MPRAVHAGQLLRLDQNFTGGVRVAVGDVNGDGVADIVTAPGPGGGPNVRVFDGTDPNGGTMLANFYAYDQNFTGGVYVAVGDINGDGKADIITGSGDGGGVRVRVFDGATGTMIADFVPYDNFSGSVRVATGDVNGDGTPDIITAPGLGGSPWVKVFDGTDLTGNTILASFFAYDGGVNGGLYIAAGDVNGDFHDDIVTAPGTTSARGWRCSAGPTSAAARSWPTSSPTTRATPMACGWRPWIPTTPTAGPTS